MPTVQIELNDDLATLLAQLDPPISRAANECIVLELFRRGLISSGKAAELLGTGRIEFIQQASALGIPYFNMTAEELDNEITIAQSL